VCYFSDERQSAAGYNQAIGHVVSRDGGQTWGAEVMDVGVQGGSTRPGMPVVIMLPNGQYLMSYEVVGRPDSEMHVKVSADGDNWGTVSDLGSLVATADDRFLEGTPYIVRSPAGGPNGEIVASAKQLSGNSGAAAPENGRTLLVNDNLGQGSWSEVASPVALTPAPTSSGDCTGWRPALVPSANGTSLLELDSEQIPGTGACHIVYGTSATTWENLGGVLADSPTVASWGARRLDVFVRGSDNALYQDTYNGNGWSGFSSLGGAFVGAPAAVSWGAGHIDVFVRGADNALYHTWHQ